MVRWRLEFERGGQLALRSGVTVIGRDPGCDIVVSDTTISRRQLLLNARVDGVELVKLGRQSVRSNDAVVDEESVLARAGDRLFFGDAHFATIRGAGEKGPPTWLLTVDDGPGLSLGTSPLVLGGGPEDHLHIPSWPPGAAELHPLASAVLVELRDAGRALVEPKTRERFTEAGVSRLEPGQTLTLGGRRLAVSPSEGAVVTPTQLSGAGPATIRIERYGRGGVLHLDRSGTSAKVYLAGLRFRLVRALIAPPSPYKPGAFIELGDLCEQIWPGQCKTEYDFNILLHRARRDLVRAELDVSLLIERAHGSGRVRAPIAEGARIVDLDR